MKVGTKSKVSKFFYKDKREAVITSDIWNRDDEYKRLYPQFLPHVGYDYRATLGTELVACFSGQVVAVVNELGSSYGRQVFLFNGSYTAHYAHLKSVNVKTGDIVKQSDLIGVSGSSGAKENTYAPHLHFGVGKGKIINASNKGKSLNDIWVDVEEFNFNIKSLDEIAEDVIDGKYGNNPERKILLEKEGYNYNEVQARVNQILSSLPKKSTEQVAKEVIDGKWGNNPERKKKLMTAGYDYNIIQSRVNQILKNK